MTSEKNEENSRELERSDIHIASSIDEEERQHLNSLNRTTKYEDAFKCSNSEAFSKKDVIYSFDNKINPFNLSSSNDRVEKIIEKSREIIKYTYFILSCLCTTLDGFILIFLGYNTSIISKENKWENNRLIFVDIIYHLASAIGGILSILTSGKSNMKGLLLGMSILFLAFLASLQIFTIRNFSGYLVIFFIICLSNGHLQNICTTQVVKKFTNSYRAAVFVFVYFFTQLGKFLFALILLIKNELISNGNIVHTVYPIVIIISLQIIFCLIILHVMMKKKKMKENYWRCQSRRETLFNTKQKTGGVNNLRDTTSSSRHVNSNKKFLSLTTMIYENFRNLFEPNWRVHSSNLVFLNFSLGIQFFSMINVFPLINGKNTQVLVDEIFYSKTLHTIFLFFIPTIYLFKLNSRKLLLFMTFTMNLFLNVLIFLDIFNSSFVIHIFRFIWNVCYITVNLYCAEAATKKIRTVNTAFMYLVFKLSCIIEIITIDRLISISLYVPIVLNIFILIGDLILVSILKVETHMKSIDEIEAELNDFGENKNNITCGCNYGYDNNNNDRNISNINLANCMSNVY